mmetsp:Transcript_54247/g.116488  ORF Transcript_54247/g.116488 Transcript_54247/m.116488 type:complete len:215 (-) Transcript_54247:55-699(-)
MSASPSRTASAAWRSASPWRPIWDKSAQRLRCVVAASELDREAQMASASRKQRRAISFWPSRWCNAAKLLSVKLKQGASGACCAAPAPPTSAKSASTRRSRRPASTRSPPCLNSTLAAWLLVFVSTSAAGSNDASLGPTVRSLKQSALSKRSAAMSVLPAATWASASFSKPAISSSHVDATMALTFVSCCAWAECGGRSPAASGWGRSAAMGAA